MLAAALTSCGRRALDPCSPASFNEQFCQDAVRNGGYYWNGSWYPMRYHNPYPYYYDSYRSYRAKGGTTRSVPGITYGHPSGGTERGGFGSTGEGHSSGGGSSAVGS